MVLRTARVEILLDDGKQVHVQPAERGQQRLHRRLAERRLDHRAQPDRLGEGQLLRVDPGDRTPPQTTSVGVSTSSYVRRAGEVIRHNFGWTLVLLGYLILIGLFYFYVLPAAMRL